MKTYISTIGFDVSQIISLIVKYGIEKGDRFVLIRPEEENDKRAENTLNEIQKFTNQIHHEIKIEVFRVPHNDFEGCVIKLMELISSSEGEVIANMSGGPREVLVPFVVACLVDSHKIKKTVSFSDIDRMAREISLPRITCLLDEKTKRILSDIAKHQPTTITGIAKRTKLSESTISRFITRLADMNAVLIGQKGRIKKITVSFTGNVLLRSS
ncbi:CRISPR-associated CARF protein Csa3 [Candidatus Methanoperedens nitratireducens]|uniref:CRISPR-associated HTH regulatory protein, Csa3 family n=1 Tax=Candidatus Methanoperedens nitratireducens TaxID=1392998 RepID=A0A284VSW6_9EURY|nr:CRISPR-associated CARF protein Csa3 [Candidatus Methanoperedens nitroreducens]SNQ62362.1 CRISPR-associated HTH regulatory protein, Csa3 family [Candidatus Methanoperedens nitroreducens]